MVNPVIETDTGDDGTVVLKVKRREGFWGVFLGAIFMVPKERKIALDKIGSEVWRLCDGAHSVKHIAGVIGERFKLHRKEAEMSVMNFLDSLAKKQLIALVTESKE